jgi:hypothetical protein
MNPQLYFAVMLITNPQKARRILLAEELENWFMDLFDEEYEDILEGTFKDNQEVYIEKIVDKYLDMTDVRITATDEYSKSVVDKAVKTASEIQETTWRNIVTIPLRKATDEWFPEDQLVEFIKSGIAIGTAMFATEGLRKWLSRERANLIALNEANWKWNNEEFFEAKSKYTRKVWHTALDERVRATHIVLEGVEIGINEDFNVGGYPALYPLDSRLPISETANCRCTIEYKK